MTVSGPIQVRVEVSEDHSAVRSVNEAAFDTPAEAGLVEALREQAGPLISLVAVRELSGAVVGHILFSPVTLSGHDDLRLMGLAPMAVVPELQGQGVGSALVKAGLEACREFGGEAVVVLGHPAYYPRFGFLPSSRFGIDSEYGVPEEVFMVLELTPGSLKDRGGRISYHPAFATV